MIRHTLALVGFAALATFGADASCSNYQLDASSTGPDLGLTLDLELRGEFMQDWALRVGFTHHDGLPMCTGIPEGHAYLLHPSEKIKNVTGVHSVLINWNSCGHPPLDNWGIAHYDVHFYHIEDNPYTLQCGDNLPPFVPCVPGAPNTEKVFKLPTTNLVKDFIPDQVGVNAMGMHLFEFPAYTAADWVDPAFMLGSWDGEVVFTEVMLPLKTITEEPKWSYDVKYKKHTNPYLVNKSWIDNGNGDGSSIGVWVGGQVPKKCEEITYGEYCMAMEKCKLKKSRECVTKPRFRAAVADENDDWKN